MAKCLNEVLQNCSEGDELVCTDVHSLNNTYLTENKSYTVTVDGDGDLCIIDDEGDDIIDASSLFVKLQPIQYSPSAPYKAIQNAVAKGKPVPPKGEWLEIVINSLCVGDYVRCVEVADDELDEFSVPTLYAVREDSSGTIFIESDKGNYYSSSYSKFIESQPVGQVPVRRGAQVNIPVQTMGKQLAESNDKPRSIVDGDYSQYCTWDIEEPETKTSEWKPDTIREDIDIMESIRHACNRT